MIELTEENVRLLILLAGGSLVLVSAMFVYVYKVSRVAYLGDRWVSAAGSYRRAALELKAFEERTDELLVTHGSRFPDGSIVRIDRLSVENLIAQADRADKGGGPGL